jgi:hypothetical protein
MHRSTTPDGLRAGRADNDVTTAGTAHQAPLGLDSLLTIPQIDTWRARRTRAIRGLLCPGNQLSAHDVTALDYAVAHHLLEGADAAARTGDAASLMRYQQMSTMSLTRWRAVMAGGDTLVVSPGAGDFRRSPLSDTPYMLVSPETPPADAIIRDLTTTAADRAGRAGFGRLLDAHAPITCLLQHKRLGDTVDSWTVTRLPGTIYLDYVDDPDLYARDLIHESGHNWLNDALTALAIDLPTDHHFFSPWKDCERPAFGFLHACWAFPLTMLYTATALSWTTGPAHRILASYLHEHRQKLASTDRDHQEAIRLLDNSVLGDRLRAIHEAARHL